MSRRAMMSVLGATALLVASVVGASSASALGSDATAPATLSFGTVPVFGTLQKDVTVTVAGSDVLFADPLPSIDAVNGAVDQAADYSVVGRTCVGTVVAGSTCTVTVEFAPFAAGDRLATLNIATTTPSGTVSVSLTGTGVPNATGTYYPLASPTRFFDSRSGGRPPLAAGSTTSVQITTPAGIPPNGISAVVFNLTAVSTGAKGYFTAYPSGTTRPNASSINFPKGWTGANMVTIPVGADGKISIFNFGGPAHAIVDVLGWYAKDDTVRAANGMGSQFLPTSNGDPVRYYDSRTDPAGAFRSLDVLNIADTWATPAEAAAVKAYAATITAVGATGPGVFTAWSGGPVVPTASVVNYEKGVTAPNMVIVPAGHGDADHPNLTADQSGFSVKNISGTVHMLVDVTGYYVSDDSAGMRFKPLAGGAPVRILDTRNGTGLSGAFTAGQTRTADATSVTSVDSVYVVGNTTGVLPTATTFLTVWSGENPLPGVSNLNVNTGLVRSVSTYAPLAFNAVGPKLTYNVFNKSGSMNVLFDAAGTLDVYPPTASPPAGVASSPDAAAGATADRSLGGRTIPGVRTFAGNLEDTSTRRG